MCTMKNKTEWNTAMIFLNVMEFEYTYIYIYLFGSSYINSYVSPLFVSSSKNQLNSVFRSFLPSRLYFLFHFTLASFSPLAAKLLFRKSKEACCDVSSIFSLTYFLIKTKNFPSSTVHWTFVL